MTGRHLLDLQQALRVVRATVEQCGGTAFRFKMRIDSEPPKPGLAVEAIGPRAIGLYTLWETGEADFEVMKDGKFVSQDSGMRVDLHVLGDSVARFLTELEIASSGDT